MAYRDFFRSEKMEHFNKLSHSTEILISENCLTILLDLFVEVIDVDGVVGAILHLKVSLIHSAKCNLCLKMNLQLQRRPPS